jgi:phosphoribosyl 1,2-cyclic phosphate phosphodiesterase
MRVVVLGSGTSMGVPALGCTCAVCTSPDPRDKRCRVAAVVDGGEGRRILIDTPPELRLQLLAAEFRTVDAVLFTHDHADHVHGIDDLRAISQRNGELPLYGPADALERIVHRFDYIFDPAVVAPEGTFKPHLTTSALRAGESVQIAGIDVVPVAVSHGVMTVFGYRFGPFAYLTDVKAVPDDALALLRGVRVLVINALFEQPHPTHLSIPEAVEVAQSIGAEQTFLTHLTHKYSHRDLSERLPDGVEPAYDGLTLNV